MYKAKFEEICSSGDIDLRVFTSRRKRLHFKEPNKRFKILNFIAENEQLLFSEEMTKKKCVAEIDTESDNNNYVIMPPLEVYLNVDKVARMKHFLKVSFKVVSFYTNINYINYLNILVVKSRKARNFSAGFVRFYQKRRNKIKNNLKSFLQKVV